jgi:dTDP-4-amino-4,6-dideoxygalactose transaminase
MMKVPLVDLVAQYRSIKPEIDRAVESVLASGQYIMGPEVEALERELAASCQAAYGISVGNGTDALELALRAVGVGPGDEVITTALSFFATAEAIAVIGAVPVFVDIDEATYNLDPALITSQITPRTTAILPVHLYGQPCDMEAIGCVAREHGLKIVEDCAQAIGAKDGGRAIGSFGDAAAFSFYPSKNLGAYGDGGLVLTSDLKIAERVRQLRSHGDPKRRFVHETLGRNSRLDELQAAMLRVKARHLEAWTEARRRGALRYAELLRRHRLEHLHPPVERPGSRHVYHVYALRVPQRDQVKQRLVEQGVGAQIHYPMTLPSQPALAAFAARSARCPKAEQAVTKLLSLPLYPELTDDLAEYVVQALVNALSGAPATS